MTVQVKVQQGVLEGKISHTCNGKIYYSFEGIPYAKPPIGNLRFRDPQPPEDWKGIRDAKKPGSRCAQRDPYSFKQTEVLGSEDCLYLNIYTPFLPNGAQCKLPVLFFVHGGRYILGYGDYYKPDYLLDHDVIFVSINYRLGILGFLCLNTPEVPGNAGLKDAACGLRWVNKNINLFNGDSNNITLFGESAGSGTITAMVTSRMCDGLYHKVIGESGSCLSDLFMTYKDSVKKAEFIASYLDRTTSNTEELLNELQAMPVEKLIDAACVGELQEEDIRAFFLPVVEKSFPNVERFLDNYPVVNLRQNNFYKVPMLKGIHSHEGALFIQMDHEGKIMYQEDLRLFIPQYTGINKRKPEADKIANNLRSYYFHGKQIDNSYKEEYLNLVSDAYFIRDIYNHVDLIAQNHKEIYFYRFSYSGNMSTRVMNKIGVKGASHGDILQYQFYRKNKADKCTESDMKIVQFLCETWCNFAKTGKPIWSNQTKPWPQYTKEDRYCLNIDSDISIMSYPEKERIEFWKNILGERCKL